MENKINLDSLKAELNNLADDFDLNDKQRIVFIEQVYDYVVGIEISNWDGVYCYVDGLLTKFEL
jgi:hypothetical protein